MSGASLAVREGRLVPGAGADAAAAAGVVVTGGAADAVRKSDTVPVGWVVPGAAKLSGASNDAYAITTVGDGTLAFDGSDERGTLYAAYDLLGRLGVRFFAPSFGSYEKHAEFVPHKPSRSPRSPTSRRRFSGVAGCTSRRGGATPRPICRSSSTRWRRTE